MDNPKVPHTKNNDMKTLITLFLFAGLFSPAFSSNILVPQQDTAKGMIYDTPEIMPQFPGGPSALDQYIKVHINYPQEAKEQKLTGKVYVQFVVEKDGSVSNVSVRMGRHEILNNEAVRVVKEMPNWKPGSNRGKIVRVRYTLPVVFAL